MGSYLVKMGLFKHTKEILADLEKLLRFVEKMQINNYVVRHNSTQSTNGTVRCEYVRQLSVA